jgi:DNA processing protein
MAGGLDRKYPKANFELFDQIKQEGALVSELPPGVAPTRWRFLQRNRLIAALTSTTVVVEAGYRSGSIRTANNALELDRELYAVPGPLGSNSSTGTNSLIGQGKAVALFDLDLFASGTPAFAQNQYESAEAKRAHDAIREIGSPTSIEISKAAGLTVSELGFALHELKIQNHVIESRGLDGQVHYALKHVQ